MTWNSNELYKLLNGLISLYKPHNLAISKFGSLIQYYIANSFNQLPSKNVRIITEIIRTKNETKIVEIPDIMSLPQVSGPNYYPRDFEVYVANPLPTFASGVQVVGIGPVGLALSAKMFEANMYMNVYRLTCLMGRSTYSGTPESNTVLRTSWKHVKQHKLDFILQNQVQEYANLSYLGAGFAPNSEAAFKAMSENTGLLRPKYISEEDRDYCDTVSKPCTIVYGLRCADFDPPFFTIEMHVLNEDIDFIIAFTKELGCRLKTAVVLTKMRRIRQGRLRAEDSLLLKDLKDLDPDVMANHMDMTNTRHSFEELQKDGDKTTFMSNINCEHLIENKSKKINH